MSVWPKRCVRCTHLIYPANRAFPWACTHLGRGLCGLCYHRCRRDDSLSDYPPVTYSRDELMCEWEMLRLEGYSKRGFAERLGMTFKAFEQAYTRARRDGDPRALPGFNDRVAA